MSFESLVFSKDWKNDTDFPTWEGSEEQVRRDMQYLFDEIRDYINGTLSPELSTFLENFEITASSWTSKIENLEGDYSEISQTVDEISLTVEDAEGDIAQLAINADAIVARVSDNEGSISALAIDLAGITAEVTNAQNDIATLALRADAIELSVENAEGDISQLSLEVDSITASVSFNETNISQLSIDMAGITLSTVADGYGGAYLQLSNAQGGDSTVSLELSVVNSASGGYSIITLTGDGTTISTSGQITLGGDVIFTSNLTDGTTTISGDNIQTGTIDASYLNLYGELSVYQTGIRYAEAGATYYSDTELTSALGTLSANTITLTYGNGYSTVIVSGQLRYVDATDTYMTLGGYIGYMYGATLSETTYGMGLTDATEGSVVIATNAGARLAFNNAASTVGAGSAEVSAYAYGAQIAFKNYDWYMVKQKLSAPDMYCDDYGGYYTYTPHSSFQVTNTTGSAVWAINMAFVSDCGLYLYTTATSSPYSSSLGTLTYPWTYLYSYYNYFMSTSGYHVTVQASSATTTNYTITLPAAEGSDRTCLVWDDGITYWTWPSVIGYGGSYSEPFVRCYNTYVIVSVVDWRITFSTSSNTIWPSLTGEISLGYSSTGYYFNNVYAVSFVSSSDRRLKSGILYELSDYEAFYDALQPTQYRLNIDREAKFRIGFVAQDVEAALTGAGLSAQDFAGLSVQHDGGYGLIYPEFIALNTYMIQKNRTKLSELEERVEALETTA